MCHQVIVKIVTLNPKPDLYNIKLFCLDLYNLSLLLCRMCDIRPATQSLLVVNETAMRGLPIRNATEKD